MQPVRAKKHLGQHFLHDQNTAQRIVQALQLSGNSEPVLEVGPGTGVLTGYLLKLPGVRFKAIEIDPEASAYLKSNWPQIDLIEGDFLKMDLKNVFSEPFSIIGNFPYNISSPIFFAVLNARSQVRQVVGMVQREVGERIVARHGSKTYGILSVLLQAFYKAELLFRVAPGAFVPPPKVQSAVIRLIRNDRVTLPCNENLFVTVVKQAFSTRRKTLRNALKSLILPACQKDPIWERFGSMRAEQLSVDDFIVLTTLIEKYRAANFAI